MFSYVSGLRLTVNLFFVAVHSPAAPAGLSVSANVHQRDAVCGGWPLE